MPVPFFDSQLTVPLALPELTGILALFDPERTTLAKPVAPETKAEMTVPRVSVVMSVYNGQRYLRRAVDSILAQEFRDFEFIIINDGSQDGSREILAEYAGRDPRIRLIDQENRGLTKALIRGCAEARGEYIARQDADDWSHPSRLASCVALLDQWPNCVIASSWAEVYRLPSAISVDTVERPADSGIATRALLCERIRPPGHGTVSLFVARRMSGGWISSMLSTSGKMAILWLRLASIGLIVYVQSYLYTLFGHSENHLGASKPGTIRVRGIRASLPEARCAEKVNSLSWNRPNGFGRRCWRRGRGARTDRSCAGARSRQLSDRHLSQPAWQSPRKEYFWTAIRLNPLHWRSWCRLGAELLRPARRNHRRQATSATR